LRGFLNRQTGPQYLRSFVFLQVTQQRKDQTATAPLLEMAAVPTPLHAAFQGDGGLRMGTDFAGVSERWRRICLADLSGFLPRQRGITSGQRFANQQPITGFTGSADSSRKTVLRERSRTGLRRLPMVLSGRDEAGRLIYIAFISNKSARVRARPEVWTDLMSGRTVRNLSSSPPVM